MCVSQSPQLSVSDESENELEPTIIERSVPVYEMETMVDDQPSVLELSTPIDIQQSDEPPILERSIPEGHALFPVPVAESTALEIDDDNTLPTEPDPEPIFMDADSDDNSDSSISFDISNRRFIDSVHPIQEQLASPSKQ
ncbi:uncharacterized protein LOC128557233 isoform X2 [Mercenaria mercenaria]|nr:uncharacterized protein LOC128557233 isoform X2 [Mercenaria mercenaria]